MCKWSRFTKYKFITAHNNFVYARPIHILLWAFIFVVYMPKYCSHCKRELPIEKFGKNRSEKDGLQRWCKECKKSYYEENKVEILSKNLEYQKENADKIKEQSKAYRNANKQKKAEQDRIYRETHKEHLSAYFKKYNETHKRERGKYRYENKEKRKEYNKRYYEEHKEERIKYAEKYRAENKEKVAESAKKSNEKCKDRIRKYQEEYCKEQMKDPVNKMKNRVRLTIGNSFKRRNFSKAMHTEEILGCDINSFLEYLSNTYYERYGEEYKNQPVHIDHIIPLATAKTEEEVIKLCHYTNLQLLKPHDNLKKSAKYNDLTESVGLQKTEERMRVTKDIDK